MKTMKRNAIYLFLIVLIGLGVFLGSFVVMPGQSLEGPLPALTAEEQVSADNMRQIVEVLAGDIGERNSTEPKAYQQAADYIKTLFVEYGQTPYTEAYGSDGQYQNIIAQQYGREMPEEIILVGAHYDTVWMTPGADDNASGVAGMLEIARQLSQQVLKRSVRFVAFANEEHPHFYTDDMGSLFHARRASERGDRITAMFSLEMLGFFSDEAESQHYPWPFNLFYPDKANFIAFVSNYKSRGLLTDSLRLFRAAGRFPSEGLAAPVMLVRDVRRSDQAAFWRYGYPALMVTDTAAYRNYNYHNVSDVPDSLDYENMARIVDGLVDVIIELANR